MGYQNKFKFEKIRRQKMDLTKKTFNKSGAFIFFLGSLFVRKLLNLTRFFGPSKLLFISPLLGAFFTPLQTCVSLGTLALCKFLFISFPVTLGIPTFFATLSWSVSSNQNSLITRITDLCVHVILPITCMLLFIAHPVGQNAFVYSFYWLIPPVFFMIKEFRSKKRKETVSTNFTVVMTALQSTFIAHAVGSIIWLYTVPTTAHYWIALMPVVAVERLVSAASMTLLYLAISRTQSRVTTCLGNLKKYHQHPVI
jgi:hypothetical protein